MARKKVVKKKIEIVFDPHKRQEFLTGFRKRKNERRKKAKDDLDRNIKEERKRIRQEIKDGVKHMKKSYEPLRELTDNDKAQEDEYEDDDVKVKIIELSTHELAAQNALIGENRAAEDEDSEDDSGEDEESADERKHSANCIPGMDFDVNAKKRKRATGGNDSSSRGKKPKLEENTADLKSKKELDHIKKTKTLKKLKKSKVFKMKERFEKTANQKKAQRDKNNTIKSLPKNQRKKKKFEPSRYRKGRIVTKKQLRMEKQRD